MNPHATIANVGAVVTTRSLLAVFAALCLALSAIAQPPIGIGDAREDVLRLVGKPNSTARRGDREIFLYPGGGRVEFIEGKVVGVKGSLPTAASAPPTPAPAEPPSTVEPAVAPVEPAPAAAAPRPTVPSASEFAEADDDDELPLGIAAAIVAGMLVAQFGLTFAALKIAFHYQQMDALWSGILAITGIDVALQTALAVVIYFQTGELRLGVAGTGLPGLAMIWSVRHFCLDQRWSRALATTSAVKIAAILLNLGLLALTDRFIG